MTLAAAVEFAVITAGEDGPDVATGRPGLARLSVRERELVTLVAQGRTDAQIAEQLFTASAPYAPTWTGFATRATAAAVPT